MSIRTENKISLVGDISNGQIIIGAFVLLLAAAVLPLFIVETPALGDYLNHLARMHIIASIDKDPQLAQYFTITWHIIPNLALDLIIPILSQYVDIYLAGKLFVFLTIALIMTGGMAVNYAVFRRVSVAPLVTSLFIYNLVLLLGLLNYLFGVGMALWGIAAWIWLRTRHPFLRAAVSLSFVLVLYFSHFYAVGLYGLALLCFEGWTVCTEQSKVRQTISNALVLCMPFIIVIPLFMATPTMELTSMNIWRPLREKLQVLNAWMFELYHPALDFTIVAVVGAVVVWGLWRRVLRLHAVGWAILFAGIVIYAIMPNTSFGCLYADYRLPITILFMVIPFSRWELTTPGIRLFTAFITGLALLRFTLVGLVWLDIDRVYADLRHAVKEIKLGSTIMVSRTESVASPFNIGGPLTYAACLATIERSAFTPNLFTLPGAQVLTVKPAYRDMEMDPRLLIPTISKISSAAKDSATARAQGFRWAEWDKHFDYLFVLYTHENDTNPLPQKLEALFSGYQFQLYRVKQPDEQMQAPDVTKWRLDKG
jgi:hypothetical protein